MELQRNHSVSDATYERAVERFGEQGVIEVVSLMGYYTMISMILNTSRAPLPAGADARARSVPVLKRTFQTTFRRLSALSKDSKGGSP